MNEQAMRLEKIDLNLFVVFDALYAERSVTRAAERLHLTQPAVSNALSRLRQQFDDQLFVRSPAGMLPTPVADSVITDVRKALGLLSRSVTNNARFDPLTAEKQFRLGIHDLLAPLVLPPLLQQLRQGAPNITLHSYYRDRNTASEQLKSGDLDLLVDFPAVNASEFRQQALGSSPYVVAMRHDHELAHRKTLQLSDYTEAEHVHVSSRPKGRGPSDIALHAQGHSRRIVVRIPQQQVAAELTAVSDLLWTTPQILLQHSGLTSKPLPFSVEPLVWNLYWHRSAEDDPANQWLRQRVIDTMAAFFAAG
ncbi:LysR family transcriptional regulator [Pseudomaricurvus sp. HS19]|uniref:LysR family transcriptional regulator n=1 Tax=Pseudomaricurvus sp. HS19 TaxID=2692626 RepID=UPI00351A4E28